MKMNHLIRGYSWKLNTLSNYVMHQVHGLYIVYTYNILYLIPTIVFIQTWNVLCNII